MSDQLFWIISVLLVVEILSQLFQFEMMGKVFVQFYVIVIYGLIGLSLATFDTRNLVNVFVVLITVINGLRFVMYKIPAFERNGYPRFFMDLFMVGSMITIMTFINPFISFDNVPVYSFPTQIAIMGSLGLSLLYEMLQRANQKGINLDDFLPRTIPSFIVVVLSIMIGLGLIISFVFDVPIYLRYQVMFGYVLGVMILRFISHLQSREPEFYDLLYVLPTLVSMILFVQLIILS